MVHMLSKSITYVAKGKPVNDAQDFAQSCGLYYESMV